MSKSRARKQINPKGKRSKRGLTGKNGRKEFYRKVSKKKLINRWTENEYLQLVSLVRDCGENWDKISEQFVNKTAKQCMQKFKNSARSAKKGNWVKQEDEILMEWIKVHGPNKWTECSKNIKGRCGKQCRERWVNILNPGVKKGNWTEDEQKLIFQNLKRYFTSWSIMAKELEGRTENSIKNYFYSSIRRLKSNSIMRFFIIIYAEPEINSFDTYNDLNEQDYSECLQKKLPMILQNRDKMKIEISKLNCLSKLICIFMLDMNQVDELVRRDVGIKIWRNKFEDSEKDFLKFLIEIVFDLNGNSGGKKGRYGKKNGGNQKRGKIKFINSYSYY